VWPDSVERIAAFLRASGTEGRLEEVLTGTGPPPGLQLRAQAFDTEGGAVVGVIPTSRSLDRQKLARAAERTSLRRATRSTSFPFQGAVVFVERTALGSPTVWLELDPPRHFLGLAPGQLLRLTHARTADLVSENRTGEVDDRAQG
jgi:prolyl-tRNA editing enzyme YbaK/EbsC (Cys-tRNA(Pro) deacylase)